MIYIRNYTEKDLDEVVRLHNASKLPAACLPDFCRVDEKGVPLPAPLFFLRKIVAVGGKVALAGFVKLTGEAFVLVDHEYGTPEWRWLALQQLTAATLAESAVKGLEDVTAFVPPEVEGFGERLKSLGFERSKWPSYTARLD